MKVPNYLKDYEKLWLKNTKEANYEWWKNAEYGLFIHYGLFSMLGKGEWVESRDKIPVAQYEKLANNFTAHNFDADYITELACECGMKYINMVTCHHDGFCLWDSKIEKFNSVNTPCNRDLVREISEMCDKKGLGFITYFTFMQNWRHPYFVNNDFFQFSRPMYDEPQSEYLYRKKEDFQIYIEYMKIQIKELLLDVGPTAALWLDIILAGFPFEMAGLINTQEIYDYVRSIRPDILISWKQGLTGTEDFAAPEQAYKSIESRVRESFGDVAGDMAAMAWEKNKGKHNDICATMQTDGWGFNAFNDYFSTEELYHLLGYAKQHNCNLTINVGPGGDGSISPIQVSILKEMKKKIDEKGMPTSGIERKVETILAV